MANVTYKHIQRWVKVKHGFTPRTCWIAHCKALAGLPVTPAPNRKGAKRAVPCPCGKRPPIMDALRCLRVI